MKDKIKSLMSEIFVCNKDEINDSTMQYDVENWDSLQHLIFVVRLEEEFDVKFTPEEISQMDGYSKIEEILRGK